MSSRPDTSLNLHSRLTFQDRALTSLDDSAPRQLEVADPCDADGTAAHVIERSAGTAKTPAKREMRDARRAAFRTKATRHATQIEAALDRSKERDKLSKAQLLRCMQVMHYLRLVGEGKHRCEAAQLVAAASKYASGVWKISDLPYNTDSSSVLPTSDGPWRAKCIQAWGAATMQTGAIPQDRRGWHVKVASAIDDADVRLGVCPRTCPCSLCWLQCSEAIAHLFLALVTALRIECVRHVDAAAFKKVWRPVLS